jgi:hypothetical protein
MIFLPQPKKIKESRGFFYISYDTEIVLDASCSIKELEIAKLIKNEIKSSAAMDININKSFAKDTKSIYLVKTAEEAEGKSEGYTLKIREEGIVIEGNDYAGLLYGAQTLREIIRQNGTKIPCLNIEDIPDFKHRGFYHDVTRGKVPTLETLKELVERLSFYKINQLQLYIEHTFAFKNMTEVWIGKDPLTAEEILELDEFCKLRNVELVPSIATFGHLYEALRTKTYSHLCELEGESDKPYNFIDRMLHHTLDVTNDESISFVKSMLHEFIPLFSSDKFNICCDETFDLGKGRSKKLNEELGTGKLYVDFLKKIINIVKGYNKEVMFWGDIIIKHPEYINQIPNDVICLNWDYGDTATEDNTKAFFEAGMKQYVCPGVSGWNRIMNAMDVANANISKMISYGKKYKALGVLNTDWGDFGHINFLANSMNGMILGAALSWNSEDNKDIHESDRAVSIFEYGENASDIMMTLRKLSRQEAVTWGDIICWKEYKTVNIEYITNAVKRFEMLDADKIAEAYKNVLSLEKQLISFGRVINENRKIDLMEFSTSARGIALMNAVGLSIKKYYFNNPKVSVVLENNKLAEELERWFNQFSILWRTRNKESEISRIYEVISYLCKYLRDTK